MKPGSTSPLGASPGTAEAPGVNFALYAPNATSVTLCLSDWDDKPLFEAPLQREGDVWHGFVPGLPQVGVAWDVGWGGGHQPHCKLINRFVVFPAIYFVLGGLMQCSAALHACQPAQATLPFLHCWTLCRHSSSAVPSTPQSKVLYGYRVDGNGGWDTPFRWDKNKVGRVAACCDSRPPLMLLWSAVLLGWAGVLVAMPEDVVPSSWTVWRATRQQQVY